MNTQPESHYFEFQASWGLTKHIGGRDATSGLIEACRIHENSHVLDVGSGVGITPCILAEKYGCDVVGVDLSADMIKRARERAGWKNLSDKIEFTNGDAQALPFATGIFDAVMSESVVAFPKDKQKVIQEYARAARPGGYVGINEATWVETPPPELKQYLHKALGQAEFLSPDGWKQLLINAGLKNVEARVYQTSALQQWKSEVRQMDIRDYLGAWSKLLSVIIKNPEARQWLKQIAIPPKSIFHLFRYFGYGLYVGMK
jgi:ubiquinone/menaquinone biosynthesis C-methylase UbiE